VPGSDVDDLL
jgi:hypothetical protein